MPTQIYIYKVLRISEYHLVKTVVSIILFVFNDGNDGVVKLNSLQVPTLLCIVQDMEQDVHSSSNDKSELYNKYDDDRESNDTSKILR